MGYSSKNTGQHLENVVQNALLKGNNEEYTPVNDFDPATKKYVDDKIGQVGGDSTIEGGAKVYTLNWDGESESVTLSQEEYDNIVEADIVVLNAGGAYDIIVNRTSKEFGEAMGRYGLAGRIDLEESRFIFNVNIEISTKLATFTMEEQDIPTKTSQLENDSNFVPSDGLKTINGESIVGSGDIVISSGSSSSGSGAYAEVNHGTSDTTFTLTPNVFHVWDEVSSLDLSLAEEQAGVANEYLFQFTSGSTATTLTLPDSIKWANDAAPTILENMIYQISILKGLASVLEFSKTASFITFEVSYAQTIHSYNADSGMTWEAWVNSEYNTDNATVLANGKILFGSYAVTDVVKDDVISDSALYYTSYYD